MKWIDKLEFKFGRYAVHGVIRAIVVLQAFVFLLNLLNRDFILLLLLERHLVFHGQVWRLVTYMFVPRLSNSWLTPDYLWIVFRLLFTWMLGDGLESVWGAFKLNIYLLLGVAGTCIAALVFGGVFDSWLLYYSLLFAFATIAPNYEIYVYFFPLKIKWLALFSAGLLVFGFVMNPSLPDVMATLFALANYAIFFGPEALQLARHRGAVAARRVRFESQLPHGGEAMHRCEVCNRTEISAPDLDFRVSADGHEYCVDHLPAKPPVT